ncbi:prepilin-type cleavage/methylation domain-containing protein [Superficieibacter electus]|uniref:Prepilin-type cleavage/methylation domain-containing protein n=1 Tax=Superficieibacter electus TaxID=2022662 RepID=A0A2P5GTB9_9ENTR|nr:prepilin-type N-terminal cleavage/methylation domain-containing protein [Superficieibacter electus]POP46322.1 prepilin-type cleavage/methylation domain-containing protein [Superficieibacter electus]POP49792.1 prepilin-type cleavage/methylation domain-containing protein [Superficieibacter electus]
MPCSMNKQKGFSLPEVLLAMALMILVVTALAGYHRALVDGAATLSQYRQLWRSAWQQTQRYPRPVDDGWRVNRMQTTRQRCVSISVIITTPVGKQGQMTRLHCPVSQ